MSRAREILFPFLTTVTLACFMVFVSCASKETVEGDEYAQEEGSIDGEVASNEEGAEATGSADAASEAKADDLEKLDPSADTAATPPAKSAQEDLASLNDPVVPAPKQAASRPAENLEELKKMMEESEKPAAPPKARVSRRGHSVAAGDGLPHISDKAIEKNGHNLNRFYFTRKGDTPSRVSSLLYGSSNKANELVAWNGKRRNWKTGSVVYYVSPFNPQDTRMQSFYQERSVPPEEVKVKRWDWLSKIAKIRLGDARSWKEVAVVSGIEKPDALEVGQRLIVYPVDLSPYSAEKVGTAQTAQAEPPKEVPVAQAPSQPEPQQAAVAPQNLPSPPPVAAEPPPPSEPPAPPKKAAKKSGNLDLAKMLEQNAVLGLFAVVALPLVILLVLVNKRRRSKRQEEQGEDPFSSSAPKKAKR